MRRRGHARTIVVGLLRVALELGARHAYLQVKSDNEPARRLYRQFGFEERYEYWYRVRPGEQAMSDDRHRCLRERSAMRRASGGVMMAAAESCTGGGRGRSHHAHLGQLRVVRARAS